MNKLFKSTNLFVLILLCLFLFISCTQTNNTQPNPTPSPNPPTQPSNPSTSTIKDLEIKQDLTGYYDSSYIKQVIYSSPNDILGSVSNNTVNLLDGTSGKLLKTLLLNSNQIIDKAFFSPNGKHLVISTQDGEVSLWSVDTGELKHTLYETYQHQYIDELKSTLVFSPDSESIAVKRGFNYNLGFEEDEFNKVDLWNVQNGSLIRSYEGLSPYVQSLVFSPDGTVISAVNRLELDYSDYTHELKMWQVNDGKLLNVISKAVARLTYSPDGKYFAANDGQGRINVWNTNTWDLLYTLSEEYSNIPAFVFSPDSKTIVSGSSQGTFKVWSLEDGQQLLRIPSTNCDSEVTYMGFASDGKSLFAGMTGKFKFGPGIYEPRCLFLFRVSDWTELLKISDVQVNSAIFTSNNSILASGDSNGELQLWRVDDGLLLNSQNVPGFPHEFVHSVAYSPNGKHLASVHSDDDEILLWNTQNKTNSKLPNSRGSQTLQFSPNGKLLLSKTWNGDVKLWDVTSGQQLLDLDKNYTALVISPDSKTFLTKESTGALVLRKIDDASMIKLFSGIDGNIVGFTHSGNLVTYTGSVVKVWDITEQKLLRVFSGENSTTLKYVTLSPDRKILASVEFDSSNNSTATIVNIWDVDTGSKLSTLKTKPYANNNSNLQVAISPNNKTLAVIDFTSIDLWDINTNSKVHTMKDHYYLPNHIQNQAFSFSPDGRNLAIAAGHSNYKNTITIYGMPNDQAIF